MKRQGFTMVELMIVVAVICALVTIIMPKMGGARERAKLNACKKNLMLIGLAAEMYANENQGCFFPLHDVCNLIDESSPYVQQGYIKNIPHCPVQPNLFYQAMGGNGGKTFHVACYPGHPYFNIPVGALRWDNEHGGVRETEWHP